MAMLPALPVKCTSEYQRRDLALKREVVMGSGMQHRQADPFLR